MADCKRCSKCGEVKALECFYRKTAASDGLQSHCKACHLDQKHNWDEKNREVMRRWRAGNRDHVAAYTREWQAVQRKLVTRSYVLRQLRKQLPSDAHIPAALVEAKGLHMKIKRLLKEKAE